MFRVRKQQRAAECARKGLSARLRSGRLKIYLYETFEAAALFRQAARIVFLLQSAARVVQWEQPGPNVTSA